jgi:acylphosphatase
MSTSLSIARLTAVVTGIVQGVSYRWFIQRRASELGLTGYVRNLPDGAVELVAEGARPTLDNLLDIAGVGPAAAVIENIDIQWSTPTGEFYRFEIRF